MRASKSIGLSLSLSLSLSLEQVNIARLVQAYIYPREKEGV